MTASPRVSVVIPSYNHGRFLDDCLASALAADVDLEVVVVDDGSTDDSRERLAACDDPRLRVELQENRGAHAALNRGIDLARGEIVFLLNSDDLFEPERIPRFLDRFESGGSGRRQDGARDGEMAMLSSWLRMIDEAGSELAIKEGWRNLPPWPKPRSGPGLAHTGDPVLALLETNYVATTSNVAFRRRIFSEGGLRFLPLRYTHDWDFLLAATGCGGFAVIEEPLVRYRVHSENTIGEGRDEGMGTMRFEILWTVARHARAICRRYEAAGTHPIELSDKLWRALPRFDCENVLSQLLLLRGEEETVPPVYDALLDPEHPFRRQAIEVLDSAPG